MASDDPRALERRLVILYAPAPARAGIAALLALDDRLAGILRTTRDPLVGQMRLTWWHQALVALDDRAPPAEPVLRDLARHVLPHGVSGALLAGMIDGWEVLLDPETPDAAALSDHGEARGGTLFAAIARVAGAGECPAAGRGWALADLAGHVADPALAAQCAALARPLLADLPRAARPLGALALIARMDLERRHPPGAPRRVSRLAFHRLTGR